MLLSCMPCRPLVQAVVSDFEAAVWAAVSDPAWRATARLLVPLLPSCLAEHSAPWTAGDVCDGQRHQHLLSQDTGAAVPTRGRYRRRSPTTEGGCWQ